MNLRTIGVTGAMGSGKSMVSKILQDLGAVIIDADVIARAVTARGSEALEELVSYFGSGILQENGELDRKKLAEAAFGDKVKLHALNSITHKHIVKKIDAALENIRSAGKSDVVVLDAPLPLKRGFLDLVDEVWVVTADRDRRAARVMERSGYTPGEVESRMNSQMRDEEYLRLADEVIENNGTIEELEKAVVRLFLHKVQQR